MVGERGEAGMRLVVGMALAAALAWAIPVTILGRQQARHVAEAAGASEEVRDAGSGVPVDPVGRAADARAQAKLNESIRVAQVHFAEHGTYERFGPSVAAGFAPTVRFTTTSATPGLVSIRGVTPTGLVLVTALGDGAYLCAAAEGDVVSFGRSNARTPAECGGGWS